MEPAFPLQVSNVSKSFGSSQVLDKISFDLSKSEMTALIGPSGSGKTTLLRGLAQLLRFDSGSELKLFGIEAERLGQDRGQMRETRTRIGYVAQSSNLVGRLSLFSNVAVGGLGKLPLYRAVFGLWPQDHVERVLAAIERVGLKDFTTARASTLSGGQQQRGAVARAIAQEAELILADEPVASLDPVSGKRVMELLANLNAQSGVSVVVSLHNIAMARRYCQRVIALHQGKIVFDGPPDTMSSAELKTIYGEEFDDAL
jgi:phosphonate transport system ATP-binding protein